MSLKGIAKQTLAILEAGSYEAPSGATVTIRDQVAAAIAGTELFTPDGLDQLLHPAEAPERDAANRDAGSGTPRIEVTDETTQIAAHRLTLEEDVDHLVLLNFASARNPGGGFINGAKAQEEDVTRCSALHPCLTRESVWRYYEVNRATSSLIYTDHLIYSPAVPFFRTRSRNLIERPFLSAIITAPAPNAGQVLRRDPDALPRIEQALRRRAGKILALAEARGHRNLLLGAWGCGVFQNVPATVADAFGAWLEGQRFAGAFDRVVFAVYDSTKDKRVRRAFEARFGAAQDDAQG